VHAITRSWLGLACCWRRQHWLPLKEEHEEHDEHEEDEEDEEDEAC